MEWSDLKQLDKLIQQTEVLGAHVEEIGISGDGRSLYGVTVGDPQASQTVVIIAGLHGAEIIAPLTAVSLLQTFNPRSFPDVRLCIVPVADPECVAHNAHELPETVTLQALLKLNHQRDLEGHFRADTYPECVAIRQWIAQFDHIEAYFSLHSAHCISPGLFFYVGQTSNPSWVSQVAEQVAAATPDWIPLLRQDPTGLSPKMLASGFFELEIPNIQALEGPAPGSSLAFVAHHFRPYYLAAPEMPLAICPALAHACLAEIDQCNHDFRETGSIHSLVKAIDLKTQIHIMKSWILSVFEQVQAAK